MKHLSKILIAVMMVMGLSLTAQDSKQSLFELMPDTRTSAGGGMVG
jgi:hypothetical protein